MPGADGKSRSARSPPPRRERPRTCPGLDPGVRVTGRKRARVAPAQLRTKQGGNVRRTKGELTTKQLHPPLPSRRLRQLHQHPKRHQHRLHPRHPTPAHNQNRQRLPPRRHHHANQRHQTSQNRTPNPNHHPHRTRNQPQLLRPLRRGVPVQTLTTSFRRRPESRGAGPGFPRLRLNVRRTKWVTVTRQPREHQHTYTSTTRLLSF